MIRQIIKIEEEKCNGCSLCKIACHEGAIDIIDGKAKLIRDDYCDGLGNCLPVCPTGAISFEEREALEYDEEAVQEKRKLKSNLPCGCHSTNSKRLKKKEISTNDNTENIEVESQLNQWPVQIKLVPTNAPYLKDSDLLIAADCTAYAYANFHNQFMKDKITLIGCPKLDDADYSEMLTALLKNNEINSITVLKMEVPCCMGILSAVKEALKNSGKIIPWNVHTISIDGHLLD